MYLYLCIHVSFHSAVQALEIKNIFLQKNLVSNIYELIIHVRETEVSILKLIIFCDLVDFCVNFP